MPQDCGNAPKKVIIKAFLIAFYQKRDDAWKRHLNNSVVWSQNGKVLNDLKEIEVNNGASTMPDKLQIEQIITHGKFCACYGQTVHGNSRTGIAYFLDFKSAGSPLIQRITEYQIALPAE